MAALGVWTALALAISVLLTITSASEIPYTEKEQLVQWAKLAEQAGRYDDMAAAMKTAAETGNELSDAERTLLSVAYDKVVGARRSSWRIISSIEQKTVSITEKQRMAKEYREKIEKELQKICTDVLVLLDKSLIPESGEPKAIPVQSEVFYLGMKGDYYRYLAEAATGSIRITAIESSQDAYQKAFDISRKELSVTDPIRIGLALKFSVFYYETLSSPEMAVRVAKQTYDEGIEGLALLDEDSAQEPAAMLQLLKNKLMQWTS